MLLFGGVRIALDQHAALFGAARRRAVLLFAGGDDLFVHNSDDVAEAAVLKVVLIDADNRSVIATANAGDVANLYEFCGVGVLQFERPAKLESAVEMAAHVVADANVDPDRRFQSEVRVEAGDGVDIFDTNATPRSDAFDLSDRYETDTFLHMAEIFKYPELVAAWFDTHQDFRHGTHLTYAPSNLATNFCGAGLAGQFSRDIDARLLTL